MVTAALSLNTWLDPPLQAYFGVGTVNWHAVIMDPVTKLPTSLPTGGAITFQWTNPPVQNTPQVLASTNDSTGAYHVSLPITTSMYGKLLLEVLLTDVSAVVLDVNTMGLFVYPSGQ